MNSRYKNLVYMTIIAEKKQSEAILADLSLQGGRCIHSMYGKGTVDSSYLQRVLGLVHEKQKTVITFLLPKDLSDNLFDLLIHKYDFNSPNTGIAFTIPIETLSH